MQQNTENSIVPPTDDTEKEEFFRYIEETIEKEEQSIPSPDRE